MFQDEKESTLADADLKATNLPKIPFQETSPCPICNEPFVKEWDEDEEEWLLKNAFKTSTGIVHYTCHQDQLASAKSASTRGSSVESLVLGKRKWDETTDAESSNTIKQDPNKSKLFVQENLVPVEVMSGLSAILNGIKPESQ